MRSFNVILAVDSTLGIAKDGKIPWHSKEDMKHFKEMTIDHIVIMGRKTNEAIGRKLPDRISLIVSENYNLDKAFAETDNYPDKKVFIIGGGEIYNTVFSERKYLRHIRYVYCTFMFKSYDCDTRIEPFDTKFKLIGERNIDDGLIMTYTRPNLDEHNYLNLVNHVIENGIERDDRTGVGTKASFACDLHFDISDHRIPMLTTKAVPFKAVFHELKWFLNGHCSPEYLKENNVKIWDKNIEAHKGVVGPMYPFQWRHAGATYNHDEIMTEGGIDQIQNMITLIKTEPTSRRILLNNWNVSDVPKGCLPPCHITFQVFVDKNHIEGLLNMRSCDLGLGAPFNIVSYSLLLHMMAHVTKKEARTLHIMFGDTHVYKNHIEQLQVQLKRCPRGFPSIKITKETDNIDDLTIEDFTLYDYDHDEKIVMDMAV